MPLVKRLSHKFSTNEKILEGKGALSYQEVRGLYFLGFFFSPTGILRVQNQGKSHYMKYFQVLALECLHFTQTDHLIWIIPALQEKLSLPFILGLL